MSSGAATDSKPSAVAVSSSAVPPLSAAGSIAAATDRNSGAVVDKTTAVVSDYSTTTTRIDPITALQDGIDGLSLAMFEALRGLRDAVAPESGNLAGGAFGQPQQAQQQPAKEDEDDDRMPDADELWHLYSEHDEGAIALIQSALSPQQKMPSTRDQVVQIHTVLSESRDTVLVLKLAETVLAKSKWIDTQVDCHIPGMHRTATQQKLVMQRLIKQNAVLSQQLQEAYQLALEKRNACRTFVKQHTGRALDIRELDSTVPLAEQQTTNIEQAFVKMEE